MPLPGEFNLGLKRRRIEDDIVALANAVNVSQREGAWLDGEAVSDFIYAYHTLMRYYEDSRDTVMGSSILVVYQAMMAFLRAAADDSRVPLRRRERAQSAMGELSEQVGNVVAQLERNLVEE